jgi:hypothetical protein
MGDLLDNVRSVKVGGFSIFDILLAIIPAYFAAPYLKMSRRSAMLLIIPFGIVVHKLVGINTPLNKMMFEPGNVVVKIIVLTLLLSGIYYFYN